MLLDQTLYSNETVESNLTIEETIKAVRAAFKAFGKNDAQMPPKNYLYFNEFNGDLRSMPAYLPNFDYATVKTVNAHPQNVKRDLPTVMAMVIVIDPESGAPVSVLGGAALTALRTAAASALATDQFARSDVRTLGLLGTGGQARDQLKGQLTVRSFERVVLYDLDEGTLRNFSNFIAEQWPSLKVTKCSNPRTVVEESDVVLSLTPSQKPIVEEVNLPDPIHINAMGADAPEKREWGENVIRECEVIVDSWDQAKHSGEISELAEEGIISKETLLGELGKLLDQEKASRNKRTIFDSTGLAIQDTAAANVFLGNDPVPDATFDFLSLNSLV